MYSDQLAKQADCGSAEIRVPNLRESLGNDLKRAEAQVARLQELIGLLDAHPEVNRIVELLGMR